MTSEPYFLRVWITEIDLLEANIFSRFYSRDTCECPLETFTVTARSPRAQVSRPSFTPRPSQPPLTR